jgi:hypothetical protein
VAEDEEKAAKLHVEVEKIGTLSVAVANTDANVVPSVLLGRDLALDLAVVDMLSI